MCIRDRFGLEIVKRVYLEGAVLGDIWMEFIPLTLMAAVCLPIAGWLFRHKDVYKRQECISSAIS